MDDIHNIKLYNLFRTDKKEEGTNFFISAIEKKYITTESMAECDYILYNSPTNSDSNNQFSELKDLSKPIIILWDTDSEIPFSNKNIEFLLFRTSLLKSKKLNNEWVLPSHLNYSWAEYDSPSAWNFSEYYSDIPSIGFCGSNEHQARKKVMSFLEKDDSINFDVVKRHTFFKAFSFDKEKYKDHRQQYLNTLKTNVFSLCIRGAGNWSIRFYETMKLGRIPVLLDTDTELPFNDLIDWNDIIIFEKDAPSLINKMKEWNSMGSDFIFDKQKKCHEIWKKYLSHDGFAENLTHYLKI